MPRIILLLLICCLAACQQRILLHQSRTSNAQVTGEQFYETAMTMQWKQRDSFAVAAILSGNRPHFMDRLVPVTVTARDTVTGRDLEATYYVTPDYLSVGTKENWARIPLTPIAAQVIADSLNCFLPTRKMVNDIYAAAVVKLAPVPMYIYRDSTVTMWQHHLIIEGQRKGQKGLIAGIKKDVVISDLLTRSPKANRVAIYGWHRLNGKAIQPLYTGHVDWYADYSHGIRLVYRKVKVNGRWMDYTAVMADPVLKQLLTDEAVGDVLRY